MAAQQPSGAARGPDGYRSEDEDSTVDLDLRQFPEVEDPVITLQQNSSMRRDAWAARDAQDQQGWQHYIPSWSRPGYDDDVEVSADGTMQRPRSGGFWSLMRPALLPTDPAATQYAR